MKTFLIAAAGVAALALAAPASAQSVNFSNVQWYGNLGYTNFGDQDANLNAITGRLGARFAQYFGVEGELSAGLGDDRANTFAGQVGVHLNNQEAVYAVGFLPVMPNADLFARVGYGGTTISADAPGAAIAGTHGSLNYGGGAQYFFTHADGIRADYTRYDYGDNIPAANNWSVAWVHKF